MDYISIEAPTRSQKRSREDDQDEEASFLACFGKKAKHSSGDGNSNWPPRDSVIGTPTVWPKPKYDSDDQSSMVSEPGSPQQLELSSGEDEEMEDVATFSSSPSSLHETGAFANAITTSRPGMGWHSRSYSNRSATPIAPPSPSSTFRTAIKQHIRHRHPQEHLSSGHLEIPSSIDEDEVATPPSAAEAAGSQLSMLSVSDMDVEPSPDLPVIAIDRAATTQHVNIGSHIDPDVDVDFEALRPTAREPVMVRKQRLRSCALSAGNSPTRSPLSSLQPDFGRGETKRVLSLGFRADCEKCRLRIPGHMNHFIT